MAALAEYATEQDAHIVFLPARLPVSHELTGLLTGSKDTTDLKRSGIEIQTVGERSRRRRRTRRLGLPRRAVGGASPHHRIGRNGSIAAQGRMLSANEPIAGGAPWCPPGGRGRPATVGGVSFRGVSMSLIQRVERAQQGADLPKAETELVVAPPAAPTTTVRTPGARRAAARDHAPSPAGSHARLRVRGRRRSGGDPGQDRRFRRRHHPPPGFRGHARRTSPPDRPDDRRDRRSRAARGAPRRSDDHRDHGQRADPHLHRTQRQDRARRYRVPQRRARPPDHRADHHAARPADRRIEPPRRRPASRRLARQRRHRASLARRSRHHHPKVRGRTVHRRRPDRLRDGIGRDVRVHAGLRSGPAQHLRLGWHRVRARRPR